MFCAPLFPFLLRGVFLARAAKNERTYAVEALLCPDVSVSVGVDASGLDKARADQAAVNVLLPRHGLVWFVSKRRGRREEKGSEEDKEADTGK